MPIGKDSIKTRVAKTAATEMPVAGEPALETTAPEAPTAEPAMETAPAAEAPAEAKPTAEIKPATEAKPAPKKRTASTATKKKPTAPKAEKPTTAVLSSVAPETVEAVVGHKEDAKVEHVQVGQKMPNYLL